MWSKTSQQREIFIKLSHLPSSQRICSSLLTRMARVLVQSVKEAGAVLSGMVLLSRGRVLCRHSIKLSLKYATYNTTRSSTGTESIDFAAWLISLAIYVFDQLHFNKLYF